VKHIHCFCHRCKQYHKRQQEGEFVPTTPRLLDNFIRIRNGIKEHVKEGAFTQNTWCVYTLLHLHATWKTGICCTTVDSLAAAWGDWISFHGAKEGGNSKHRTILDCLQRLRDMGYIRYPKGNGQLGTYPILINKYEPTRGALRAWQLNAAQTTDFRTPVYDYTSPTPFSEAYGQSPGESGVSMAARDVVKEGVTVDVTRVPSATLQDVLRLYKTVQDREDGKDGKDGQQINGPGSFDGGFASKDHNGKEQSSSRRQRRGRNRVSGRVNNHDKLQHRG
jgi:hypothetical protein